MNTEMFQSWLDSYGHAYEKKDTQAFKDLFTDDAIYYANPFTEPLHGHSAILDYFSNIFCSQDHIQFSYEILSVSQDVGIAHWWVSFVQVSSKTKVKLDGIFVVSFDGKRCKVLKQWWHWLEYSS